ncbi:unnamed protein product [Ilex paraguariensis]|uniref:Uncharacterized protein n=1 Tax=Ilex paraguariensis TaxID=185542 RepID=A0ABC8T3R2_9AQUA
MQVRGKKTERRPMDNNMGNVMASGEGDISKDAMGTGLGDIRGRQTGHRWSVGDDVNDTKGGLGDTARLGDVVAGIGELDACTGVGACGALAVGTKMLGCSGRLLALMESSRLT